MGGRRPESWDGRSFLPLFRSIKLRENKHRQKAPFSSQTFRVKGHVRIDLKRCNPLDGVGVGGGISRRQSHTHTQMHTKSIQGRRSFFPGSRVRINLVFGHWAVRGFLSFLFISQPLSGQQLGLSANTLHTHTHTHKHPDHELPLCLVRKSLITLFF